MEEDTSSEPKSDAQKEEVEPKEEEVKDAASQGDELESEESSQGPTQSEKVASEGSEGSPSSSSSSMSPSKEGTGLLPVSEETIRTLSNAFIEAFQPHFEHSRESLHELIRNQELLLDTVQQENRKYEENHMLEDVNETMKKARLYQSKLVNIRKEMVHLHERVGKLKKRALKLQNQRMKENLQREQQKEREYEEDRLLRARPAANQQAEGSTGPGS